MDFWHIWGAPERIIYAPILILVWAIIVYRAVRQIRAARLLAGMHPTMLSNFSPARQLLKVVLLMLGSLALFLALLQPQWNKKEHSMQQEGRDLFIALDVSRSMLAADCTPNRLACAKQKIKELVSHLSCERVGLILFSGSTFVQCPLTSDYGAFYMFLDQIDVETISSGTTAIDQALKKALESFDAGGQRKNRLLVLFTDGEDFSSNLTGVKQEAAAAGMHIFTVGVGTVDGAPIPLFDARGKSVGHQKDKKGLVVISRLNEGILQNLAHDSGGIYLKMTPDDSDVRTIINQVSRYEKEKFEEKKVASYEQNYPYFVAVSFICFAVEWLI